MKVLHIDSELGWRGGQRQTEILIRGLDTLEFQSHLMVPPHSTLGAKLENEFPVLYSQTKGIHQLAAAKRLLSYAKSESVDLPENPRLGGRTTRRCPWPTTRCQLVSRC